MDSPFSLFGKVVLITGASSGIGKQTALLFSRMGATVVITGRNKERLNDVFQSLDTSSAHRQELCDLSDFNELSLFVEKLPVLDGIVFCAGVLQYMPVRSITEAKAFELFKINYFSQVFLVQKLTRAKKISSGGSLLFISSISSDLGVPGTMLYSATKAALNSSVKVMASEFASKRIRVNALCPGIVRTPLIESDDNSVEKEIFDRDERFYPLGYGSTSDVASAAAYYISDASKWVTGNIMKMDGGLTLS